MVLFAIAVAFDLLGGWREIPHVVRGGLFNPDSYMRLDRIEAGLRAGHIGYWIPRAGFVLHWSHLLDSLLLAAAAPLVPLLGWHRALFSAGAVSGPVSVGLLAVAVAWAGAPLSEPRFRWWASVAVGMAPAIEGYGRLGVIHHHVLLVVVAVMVAGYAFRAAAGERRCGMAAGAWFAFGLWLTPEIWPFGILALGALGVGWLTGVAGTGRALAVAGVTTSVLVGAILPVDPPPGAAGAIGVAFDHVSVVHLALALAVAAVGAGLEGIDRAGLVGGRRAALGIGVGCCLIGAWVAIFPRAVAGPAGMSTAPGAGLMLAAISEMQPVVRPALVATFLLGGFFGVAGAGWIAWRRRSWLAAYGAGCGLVVLALGFRYVRFSPYGEALGAAMLPPVLTAMDGEVVWRVGLLAVLLLLPRVAPAFAAAPRVAGCALEGVAARLAPDAGQMVLASADLTPALLYRTRVRVVGGLYVRDVAGFLRGRAAWRADVVPRGPGARVPEAVRASGASLVLFCRRASGSPGATLAGALARGRAPPWLRLLWYDRASGFALYRISFCWRARPGGSRGRRRRAWSSGAPPDRRNRRRPWAP